MTERQRLRALMLSPVQIVLLSDQGDLDREIAAALPMSMSTIWSIRTHLTEDGVRGSRYAFALQCRLPPMAAAG